MNSALLRKTYVRVVLVAGVAALALTGCAGKKKPRLQYEERPVELLYNTGADRLDRRQWDNAVAYFEEVEEDTGDEIELDVIAICCEYSVDSVEDIASNYSIDIEDMDEDVARDAVIDYLNDNTTVIDGDCNGQILYCSAF